MKPLPLDYLADYVADFYGVKVAELKNKCRSDRLAKPRFVFTYLARRYANTTYLDIGRFLGGRDHSTTIHGERCIQDWMKTDLLLNDQIAWLEKGLKEQAEARANAFIATWNERAKQHEIAAVA